MKKSEKQKWLEMNKDQRKQYFMDYYLFPVSVIIIILAIVCFLGWHFFLKPDEENILYAAVVDDSLDQEKQEQAVIWKIRSLQWQWMLQIRRMHLNFWII